MALMRCSNCGTENASDARFCQKCGNSLFTVCRRCGTENVIGVEFCKNCGTKLSEAQFALSPEAVTYWRSVLGGLEGWSPFFTSSSRELELFGKLDPPLDVNKEQFIFRKEIIPRHSMIPPHPPFSVSRVTIREQEFEVEGFFEVKKSFLLGTDRRLLGYYPKGKKASQILYEEIVSLDVQGDHFILDLKDRGIADLHMKISQPGLLGAAAIMGAPLDAKGHIALLEKSKAERAQTFVVVFSEFFIQIIEENKRRR